VYFADIIRKRIRSLRSGLADLNPSLLFAMKANHHPAILTLMRDEGLGIDAVSPAELLLVLRLGFDPGRILFSANNMTDDEMHFARQQGVLLNIGELSRLERFGQAFPGSAVCVRVNPQIGGGHHNHVITAGERSKFGIPIEQIDTIRSIARRFDLRLVGLHQHIGSGILDTNTLWLAISVLLDAAREFPDVRFLNLGGGLGVPYRPDETGIDLENLTERIVRPLLDFRRSRGNTLEFWFEPGRFLVAESGVLLVRANTIKRNPTRTFAGVDSGMVHLLRPALYNSYHEITNLSNPQGPKWPYDVVGNICESGDRFAENRPISEIREDDVLGILDVGAYGMSMASPTYNLRPVPAEVLVPGETDPGRFRLISRRMTAAELVARIMRDGTVPDDGTGESVAS
jgi:diaminopimelate decarboxylase